MSSSVPPPRSKLTSDTLPGFPLPKGAALPPMRPRGNTLVGMAGLHGLPSRAPEPSESELAFSELAFSELAFSEAASQAGESDEWLYAEPTVRIEAQSTMLPPRLPEGTPSARVEEPAAAAPASADDSDDLPRVSEPPPSASSQPYSHPPVVRSLIPSEPEPRSGWPKRALMGFAAVAAIALTLATGAAPMLEAAGHATVAAYAATAATEARLALQEPAPAPAAAPPITATAKQGAIAVSSRVPCNVWIGGSPYGRTGTARAALKPGKHIVACEVPSGHMFVRSVRVKAGQTTHVRF